ncbi:MAG: type II toxin-antitoxin system Phd/YefM family antitoxin [Anaerolineae bacterium]
MIETKYAEAIANMDKFMDEVVQNRDVVIIHRSDAEDVALIAADELRSLLETAHLLRSPKNAERLLTALARAREQSVAPQSVDDLKRDLLNDESNE